MVITKGILNIIFSEFYLSQNEFWLINILEVFSTKLILNKADQFLFLFLF